MNAGDKGFYVLPKSDAHGRTRDLYWSCTVKGVTSRGGRLIIVLDGAKRSRNVAPSAVVATAPIGAWIKEITV